MNGADRLVQYQRLLPALLLLTALLWLLRGTAEEMVQTWNRSATFTHAFLVPPIVLWLVWRQRDLLAKLPSRPEPWLLLPIAGTCFLWLLGELATVGVVSQFALVTLILLCVPALFGWAITRALAFPLAFLYFAVPFGDFAVPKMMAWTADFTVAALRATGVPVYRDGLQFVIPSGNWSVVEACSGVRFLIAAFMVGTLFAYLNYRSAKRRAIFMALSLLIPIVANWVRAYTIVMIGHLSSNSLAVGFDHLIYGWIFFGVVIGLMYVIGARWSEGDEPVSGVVAMERAAAPGRLRTGWGVAAGILFLLAGTQAWARYLDHRDVIGPPRLALMPAAGAWVAAGDKPLPWSPGFRNPSGTALASYEQAGQRVWVWLGYYRQQGGDRKLVSSMNGVVAHDDDGWGLVEQGSRRPTANLPSFRTATARRSEGIDGAVTSRLRVWQVYWIGGEWITSDAHAKLRQALDRLLGNGDDGAVVLLVSPQGGDADAVLERFANDHLGSVAATLSAARETR